MEAVLVRGDTASCRAHLNCEGRDIADFGLGAQSQGQMQAGRCPAPLLSHKEAHRGCRVGGESQRKSK